MVAKTTIENMGSTSVNSTMHTCKDHAASVRMRREVKYHADAEEANHTERGLGNPRGVQDKHDLMKNIVALESFKR